jgi:hypothetical protein
MKGCKILAYARRSGPLSREGSLSCHTHCNTGPRFFRSHPKDHPFSRLLRHTRECGGSILTRILTGYSIVRPFSLQLQWSFLALYITYIVPFNTPNHKLRPNIFRNHVKSHDRWPCKGEIKSQGTHIWSLMKTTFGVLCLFQLKCKSLHFQFLNPSQHMYISEEYYFVNTCNSNFQSIVSVDRRLCILDTRTFAFRSVGTEVAGTNQYTFSGNFGYDRKPCFVVHPI